MYRPARFHQVATAADKRSLCDRQRQADPLSEQGMPTHDEPAFAFLTYLLVVDIDVVCISVVPCLTSSFRPSPPEIPNAVLYVLPRTLAQNISC